MRNKLKEYIKFDLINQVYTDFNDFMIIRYLTIYFFTLWLLIVD